MGSQTQLWYDGLRKDLKIWPYWETAYNDTLNCRISPQGSISKVIPTSSFIEYRSSQITYYQNKP